MAAMSFADAATFKMPFGQYKGQMLDEIASTDAGLRYLDYMLGELDDERRQGDVYQALLIYLSDESIAKDVAELNTKY